MGMYTELCIGVKFKPESPAVKVIDVMANPQDVDKMEHIPEQFREHTLFKTSRWYWMLNSSGSAYFNMLPVCKFEKEGNNWYLTVWTNIKNYSGEWEAFLEFIAPYITNQGFIGFTRYEEEKHPTLIYIVDGKPEYRKPIEETY